MQELNTTIEGIRAGGGTAVVLIRHARTLWNADRRFLGRTDIPLDEEGRRQAAALAARLQLRDFELYTSPLSRAAETAAALGSATRIEALAELDQGELEGLDGPRAFSRFPDFFAHWARDPETAPTPGGETLGQLQRRAWAAVEELASRHRGGTVVAVSHQMVASALGCAASGEPLTAWRDHRLPHVGVKVLARVERGWTCLIRRIALVEVSDG